ncbi:hypothetical protein D6821_02555, partial [Candidatus Parcubacteria bacterium]
MTQLNAQQKQAVKHADGPLLIVAGAGTGKTTVLIERLNFLLQNKLAKAEEVLIITFTEKAAEELEVRADKILPYGWVDLWIDTFHGFCQRILEDHGLEVGLPGGFKLLSQTEQWMFIRKHLDEFELDYYRPLGNPTKFIHALAEHFSRLKDENISPQEYLDFALEVKQNFDQMLSGEESAKEAELELKKWQELANAYHIYNRLLLDKGLLD